MDIAALLLTEDMMFIYHLVAYTLLYPNMTFERSKKCRVCEFTGLECENGVLEWNTGVEYWSVQTDFLEANIANISRSTLGLNTTFNIVYHYTICFGVHDKLCRYNTSTAHACALCISFSFYSLFMDDNSIQVLIK